MIFLPSNAILYDTAPRRASALPDPRSIAV
jgi:hypothetical protein